MAFKMVFMVRLPGTRTHVTEVLTASTRHIVATHGPFNCLFTPWAYLSISTYPFSISLLTHDLLNPFNLLVTLARVVIITHTPETELFTADAPNYTNIDLINLNAITTVSTSTKLIISIFHNQLLTQFLQILLPPSFLVAQV